MKNKHTLANKRRLDNKTVPLVERMVEPAERLKQQKEQMYTKWWQKLFNWITFGLYKPTTFWYKVKLKQ